MASAALNWFTVKAAVVSSNKRSRREHRCAGHVLDAPLGQLVGLVTVDHASRVLWVGDRRSGSRTSPKIPSGNCADTNARSSFAYPKEKKAAAGEL